MDLNEGGIRISKDKDFAEYYLLGTLISVAIVIVVSFIL